MNRLLLIVVAVFILACSPQKKLQKTYIGLPISAMEKEFGQAKSVFEKSDGKEYIFEKVEYLKSTEISQHKLTLDPMVSPRVKKTKRYSVTVVDEIISKIKLDEEYER